MNHRSLPTCLAALATVASPGVAGLMSGCAYVEERFRDDTGRPGFEGPYRAGETYRLQAEGRVVSVWSNGGLPGKATERLELWSPRIVAANADFPRFGQLVATVPAGTTVRVEGQEHNYTVSFPPVPGDSQILRAYGTVEVAGGAEGGGGGGRWEHVRMPDDRTTKPSFVPGSYIMRYRPDEDFLERMGS